MNFNGLDGDELTHLLDDRKIKIGEQTKTRIKEDYGKNSNNLYFNKVAIRRPNDLMPTDLLPKSSNNVYNESLPSITRPMDRILADNMREPLNYIERPEFLTPVNSNLELEKMNKEKEEGLFSISSSPIQPKSILKKPKPIEKPMEKPLEKTIEKSIEKSIEHYIEQPMEQINEPSEEVIDIEKILVGLRRHGIRITSDELLTRIKMKNVDTINKLRRFIVEIVNEFKPKKMERKVEIMKVFNEKDYYKEKIRICINSDERDITKYHEPNNFEVNLPKNGLSDVCSVRLISLIMPKILSDELDNYPFLILEIKEIGQNFIMNNGRVGGLCQIIFEKENYNFKIANPDENMATKILNPIRNINKLTIRLLKPDGEPLRFKTTINEEMKLEIEKPTEDKPKIKLPDYSPDPNFEIKKLDEATSETNEKVIQPSDGFAPISLLFEFLYYKKRGLVG